MDVIVIVGVNVGVPVGTTVLVYVGVTVGVCAFIKTALLVSTGLEILFPEAASSPDTLPVKSISPEFPAV